ncbi:MAG: preprotein translocase subunit YajC [Gammaproteobacteria bacterium]|jgi:preprotein translocase subunit YajC|nr:preprotein translocase subunit YajC [Gammaproteobacteria bacterium]
MGFFIEDAWAQEGAAAAGGFASLLPLILIFVIFYFLLLRPQIKRAKEHKKMVEALARGDEVITTGGLLGRITRLDENFVSLELAEGVVVRVQRSAVGSMVPKGTIKKDRSAKDKDADDTDGDATS